MLSWVKSVFLGKERFPVGVGLAGVWVSGNCFLGIWESWYLEGGRGRRQADRLVALTVWKLLALGNLKHPLGNLKRLGELEMPSGNLKTPLGEPEAPWGNLLALADCCRGQARTALREEGRQEEERGKGGGGGAGASGSLAAAGARGAAADSYYCCMPLQAACAHAALVGLACQRPVRPLQSSRRST